MACSCLLQAVRTRVRIAIRRAWIMGWDFIVAFFFLLFYPPVMRLTQWRELEIPSYSPVMWALIYHFTDAVKDDEDY